MTILGVFMGRGAAEARASEDGPGRPLAEAARASAGGRQTA
jgi:hypothetical protein